MKRTSFLFLIFLLSFNFVFAQITISPDHDFYKSAKSWQNRGLISQLPPVRPYPFADIKEILNTIIENGSETDVQLAQEYWLELTGKIWNAQIDADFILKAQDSDSSKLINLTPQINGNINLLKDSFNIAYDMGISIRNAYDISAYLPSYSNYDSDGRFDPAEIKKLQMFIETNDIFSYSSKGIILQGGVFRNGYGDFINEGVALNEGAFHRPSILFSYSNKLLSYTQQLSMLGATVNTLYYKKPKDNKYLAFHAFELRPFNWFNWSFYETSIYGKRFDIAYLLPLPYMTAQSFSGYGDSLMMGTRFKIIPNSSLAIMTDLLVDDLAVNDLVKLNFNSKNRVAWNTGIEWTPEPTFVERLALNFLIITPYTYSHWDYNNPLTEEMTPDTLNYQNYTNCGFTLGSTNPPNSMQVKLNFDFNPVKNLKIELFGSYMLHANIVESLTDDEQMIYARADKNVYSTDGSIYTHPYYYYNYSTATEKNEKSGYIKTAWNYMNFLNEPHKMQVIQAGLKAQYKIASTSWGNLAFKAGYTFEFIKNKGVDSNIYPGSFVTYDTEAKTYTYIDLQGTEHTTAQQKEVLDYYRNSWASRLHDQTGHFIYIGVEYKY